jgi:hypothetical protein
MFSQPSSATESASDPKSTAELEINHTKIYYRATNFEKRFCFFQNS